MKDTLIQAGLTTPQADTYLLLLDAGSLSPPTVAERLALTRSNAYKVLEQLMEIGLAEREERNKKYVYRAGDPTALNDLLARERNKVIALEKAINDSLQLLRNKYQQQTSAIETKAYHGGAKLKRLYEQQAETKQPVYFIKSRADIPTLGFEMMDYVRKLPARYGTRRYGITQDAPEASLDPAVDDSTNLTRTWIDAASYTSPVEWSVSGDEVTIFIFEKDGSAVRIKNQTVANSFREIYTLLDSNIRANPEYHRLPCKAERVV